METRKKKTITIESLLYIFVILCPILDIISFLFRNTFHTTKSPSTFLRPIIPMLVLGYLFFKSTKKRKLIVIGCLYASYAVIHLWIFSRLHTTLSFGGIRLELQHVINYSFMIVTLFVFGVVFINKDRKELRKSVLIAATFSILSILLAIITQTSSPTYIEGIGQKGWFESGNSLGAMLILMLCILLPLVKDKKQRIFAIIISGLIAVYLTIVMGTRVGLFGCIMVLFLFTSIEILDAIIHRVQLNKYIVGGGIIAIIAIVAIVFVVGSNTLQRRQFLKEIEANVVDEQTNEVSHLSLSLLEIRDKIERGAMTKEELSEEAQQSILDLYAYANETKIVNNDMRSQQLIYNVALIKNQANPWYLLFGNGYVTNFRELVLEMEILAFLFNYGIAGFILYFVPFLAITIYAIIIGVKNRKKINAEYSMNLIGCLFSYALAMTSGYIFFNVSTMTMIVILHVLLLNKTWEMKHVKEEK